MADDSRRRLAEATEQIARHYGVVPPSPRRLDELLPFLAKALAALLVEVRPRTGEPRGRKAKA